MEPAGAMRHGRSPAGVEARERRDQSNLRVGRTVSCHFNWRGLPCPRRESNPHLRFRKPSFYPLNYGDAEETFDFRFPSARCPVAEPLFGPARPMTSYTFDGGQWEISCIKISLGCAKPRLTQD